MKIVYYPDGTGRYFGHECTDKRCKPKKSTCKLALQELAHLINLGVISKKENKL